MSKRSEGKDDRPDIMDLVQEFCMSNDFESEFEMFAKEHMHTFRDCATLPVRSSEHPLEYHDVYQKYLHKFEGMIEDFIVKVRWVACVEPHRGEWLAFSFLPSLSAPFPFCAILPLFYALAHPSVSSSFLHCLSCRVVRRTGFL